MLSTAFLICALCFGESKGLIVQIHLDRAGYSCSAIDGQWGGKSRLVLARYLTDRGLLAKGASVPSPDKVYDRCFADKPDPFRIEEVTQADLNALVKIPEDPSARALLPRMGYESIKEMFAERGHLSQTALVRLNPGVDWENVRPGLKLIIPDFPSIGSSLKSAGNSRQPKAALVRVSLTNCTVTALDASGRTLAIFPCSIAANKSKVPPQGELKVTSYIPWPNYTYTPDYTPPGKKVQRHIWPAG